MPDPISTLALATGGAFLGKFVGPAAEHLGKLALERAQQLGQKATALLNAVGREPEPVELKLLLPLVQAASLESDYTLAEQWAALLANAADPAQRVQVQPSFVEVLRQLTPDEAQVLSFIYNEWSIPDKDEPIGEDSVLMLTIATVFSHFGWSGDRMFLCLDNLLRQRLYEDFRPITYGGVPERELSQVLLTAYGAQFMRAVTPPAS